MDDTATTHPTTEEFWEGHYGARERVWSGRVNGVLADVAGALPPGTALDLGCGEGGDAVWLARRGWQVTAVDVSPTALRRLAELAAAEGVADRISVERHDLGDTFPAGEFGLVSAQFLQSPIAFARTEVLRAAAAAVAPGGLLLVVEHGPMPAHHHHDQDHPGVVFRTPQEVLADLALPAGWQVERLATPTRPATLPTGEQTELTDTVVAARRPT